VLPSGASFLSSIITLSCRLVLTRSVCADTMRCNSLSPLSNTAVTFPLSSLSGDSLSVKAGQGRPATEAVSGHRTVASGSGLYLGWIAMTYHCKRLRPPASLQRRSIARLHPGASGSREMCLPSQASACARIWLQVILSPPFDMYALSFSIDSRFFGEADRCGALPHLFGDDVPP
jgi:hypothetical protein